MTPRHEPPTNRARFCLLAAGAAMAAAGSSLDSGSKSTLKTASISGVGQVDAKPTGPSDDELKRMILGRWKTTSSGERIIVNRPDGTASMDVTFDFLTSLIYGEKMQLELKWTLDQGVLDYTITSGTPAATKDSIVKAYGAYASYHFHSISARQMHLVRVIDPSESYIWTRID